MFRRVLFRSPCLFKTRPVYSFPRGLKLSTSRYPKTEGQHDARFDPRPGRNYDGAAARDDNPSGDRPPCCEQSPTDFIASVPPGKASGRRVRSEEHTSELQSLMRISYAVFCLKKKNNTNETQH